jgi:hypothetical protein
MTVKKNIINLKIKGNSKYSLILCELDADSLGSAKHEVRTTGLEFLE